jgi:hypothetical protein
MPTIGPWRSSNVREAALAFAGRLGQTSAASGHREQAKEQGGSRMADYVKLRLHAAKVGVSMALLAAISGLAERAQASPQPRAHAAFGFLKLSGISKTIATPLLKLEKKLIKVNGVVKKLERKDRSYLTQDSANSTFLKIKTADSDFASIKLLNTDFLKISDASFKYLKIDATAANAAELGGLKPDAFVQGRGGVVSAGILIGLSQPAATPLLKTPDGKLAISILANADQVTLTFANNTGGALEGLGQDVTPAAAGGTSQVPLPPGDSQVMLKGTTHQYHLQLFPNASNEPMTLTLSTEPSGQSQLDVVAQMLIGQL